MLCLSGFELYSRWVPQLHGRRFFFQKWEFCFCLQVNLSFCLEKRIKTKNVHLFPYKEKIDLRRRPYTKYNVNHKYKLWQIPLFAMCEWEQDLNWGRGVWREKNGWGERVKRGYGQGKRFMINVLTIQKRKNTYTSKNLVS